MKYYNNFRYSYCTIVLVVATLTLQWQSTCYVEVKLQTVIINIIIAILLVLLYY